ncbi:DNA-3-methyladenine glycosylase 2 family protein [Sphingorhabdus sp. Alg239-R122]|uniref:DNA-3-methyladenine glycosylase family protein n=1 Tax=Sphingorhabdus sp. Alg239-R122 TaxID=2305989 RepID=UPI0013DADC81|nr:DNA-3-methyladenine glycosylase 2 family protein [Sphingorhabdus sp. Alg239-R122]
MGLSKQQIIDGLTAVSKNEPLLADAIERTGYPEPRIRERGYQTLLRTIVGQQVSVAAASSVWNKLEAHLGDGCPAEAVLESDFDALRTCGLSRQKQGYARSLAELITTGELPLDNLPADDEKAIEYLTRVKGIGRWSAEIYLLFAESRADIWPAGDLAVQAGIGKILNLPERPSEKEARALAEPWSPHRGAVAIFTWHSYNNPAL